MFHLICLFRHRSSWLVSFRFRNSVLRSSIESNDRNVERVTCPPHLLDVWMFSLILFDLCGIFSTRWGLEFYIIRTWAWRDIGYISRYLALQFLNRLLFGNFFFVILNGYVCLQWQGFSMFHMYRIGQLLFEMFRWNVGKYRFWRVRKYRNIGFDDIRIFRSSQRFFWIAPVCDTRVTIAELYRGVVLHCSGFLQLHCLDFGGILLDIRSHLQSNECTTLQGLINEFNSKDWISEFTLIFNNYSFSHSNYEQSKTQWYINTVIIQYYFIYNTALRFLHDCSSQKLKRLGLEYWK